MSSLHPISKHIDDSSVELTEEPHSNKLPAVLKLPLTPVMPSLDCTLMATVPNLGLPARRAQRLAHELAEGLPIKFRWTRSTFEAEPTSCKFHRRAYRSLITTNAPAIALVDSPQYLIISHSFSAPGLPSLASIIIRASFHVFD